MGNGDTAGDCSKRASAGKMNPSCLFQNWNRSPRTSTESTCGDGSRNSSMIEGDNMAIDIAFSLVALISDISYNRLSTADSGYGH
ncbi:uncharacterized protein YALI1_A18719g [Yarrowia lipolytica]|uniref:Uncharacterized protein n=1 Tax=Yarrowia lipolytica TaxID=4952 RepID=A0A1D8N5B3_YARLL|nr:hypothetical protein YALI1_A18719g [Yarrowia lipolytica]